MFDAFSEPKVSKNILDFYKEIEEAKISLSDTSEVIAFAKGMKMTDEEFLKFISNTDNADKSLSAYKKQLVSSTDGLSKFSAGFKSLAANLGIMLAITVAVKALSAAFDYLNVTFEEQQEIVDGLNDKISTLQSEYDELAGKSRLQFTDIKSIDAMRVNQSIEPNFYDVITDRSEIIGRIQKIILTK